MFIALNFNEHRAKLYYMENEAVWSTEEGSRRKDPTSTSIAIGKIPPPQVPITYSHVVKVLISYLQ